MNFKKSGIFFTNAPLDGIDEIVRESSLSILNGIGHDLIKLKMDDEPDYYHIKKQVQMVQDLMQFDENTSNNVRNSLSLPSASAKSIQLSNNN